MIKKDADIVDTPRSASDALEPLPGAIDNSAPDTPAEPATGDALAAPAKPAPETNVTASAAPAAGDDPAEPAASAAPAAGETPANTAAQESVAQAYHSLLGFAMHTRDILRLAFYAFAVGLITSASSIIFGLLIDFCHHVFFGKHCTAFLPLPLILALGGLIVGLIVLINSEGSGGGIPEVIASVIMNGGRIKGRTAILKMITSAITIGSGGSAGREGPIVRIGAALASKFGQMLHLSEGQITLLVACGAAAGISAVFNAPLAGVFFALEILLGRFSPRAFGLVVLSSVTSSVVARSYYGNHPVFEAPAYTMVNPEELGWYLGLGVLAGFTGLLFSVSMHKIEDFFAWLKIPKYLKPALGGLTVGFIALYYPQVLGNGYEGIFSAITGSFDFQLMAGLVIMKMLATAMTLGSGGSGGDLAPSLFVGAMLGGAYGCAAHSFSPYGSAESGAYALVGMAAVFGATSRAPMTAVLMIFELTADYYLMLPLMAVTVIAVLTASVFDRESIYSYRLSKRGLNIWDRETAEKDPMRRVTVREAMTTDFVSVSVNDTVEQLSQKINETGYVVFPVTDNGMYYGMVTAKDYEYARLRNHELVPTAPVTSIMLAHMGYVCSDDNLALALRAMGRFNTGCLAVLDSGVSKRIIGLLRRSDIVSAYNKAISAPETEGKEKDLQVRATSEADFLDIRLPNNSAWDNAAVKNIPIPQSAVLVAVKRDGETIIPHGDTILRSADDVVIYCKPESRAEMRRLFGSVKK